MTTTLAARLTHLRSRFPAEPTDSHGRILQAAAELFSTHGYVGTSTDMIAKSAGVKPPALYRQFESKQAILYAFLENVYEGFRADIEEAVADVEDPATRLARFAWAHTWIQLSFGSMMRADVGTVFMGSQLLSSLSEQQASRIAALVRAHVRQCREIIEEGERMGVLNVPDSRSAALAVTTMCEYSALWFRPDGPLTAEEVADRNALYALRIAGVPADG